MSVFASCEQHRPGGRIGAIPCPHQNPWRVLLRVVLMQEERAHVGARDSIYWGPVGAICSECLAPSADPLPRLLWWLRVYAAVEALALEAVDDAQSAVKLSYVGMFVTEAERHVRRPSRADLGLLIEWLVASGAAIGLTDGPTWWQLRAEMFERFRARTNGEAVAAEAQRVAPDSASTANGTTDSSALVKRPSDTALALLGLSWPCSRAEFTQHWRQEVQAHHPDHGGSLRAFIALKNAREEIDQHLRGAAAVASAK